MPPKADFRPLLSPAEDLRELLALDCLTLPLWWPRPALDRIEVCPSSEPVRGLVGVGSWGLPTESRGLPRGKDSWLPSVFFTRTVQDMGGESER
mmetsp:Transcript_106192/g.257991  ORF Transcript_106192/g.257991 Transcript_106192/m.257991 type:complete len:94 (+) Transcript_106192:749-1030(+)